RSRGDGRGVPRAGRRSARPAQPRDVVRRAGGWRVREPGFPGGRDARVGLHRQAPGLAVHRTRVDRGLGSHESAPGAPGPARLEGVSDQPPPLPPYPMRDPGDAWVEGPDGSKYWGRFGAAGLLCWHRTDGILLQHRVAWSHFGGTWGLPGGARKQGEDAVTAAIREAAEEATVPPDVLRVIGESVLDLGFWSYTTVIAEAMEPFS